MSLPQQIYLPRQQIAMVSFSLRMVALEIAT
jgi:hypothetical protein